MFEESSDWGAKSESSDLLHSALFTTDQTLKSNSVCENKARRRKKREHLSDPCESPVKKNRGLDKPQTTESQPESVDDGKRCKKANRKRRTTEKRKQPASVEHVIKNTDPLKAQSGIKKSKLLSKMESKMEAGRFRWINEQLYTTTGQEAKEMFKEDPELFRVYHSGFATQVSKWPVNPVDRVISYVQSLPEHLVIADFGCGEAKLAQSVPHRVFSFDLVACNSHVTACDMAHVPLENRSVDVCVFCLSLMGTNLSDFVREAKRVLVKDGRLKVCEIVSRLPSIDEFVGGVEALGFSLISKELLSTMFVELEFGAVELRVGRRDRGKSLHLKPCCYKKR